MQYKLRKITYQKCIVTLNGLQGTKKEQISEVTD